MLQLGMYSYIQRYASSQWPKCCGLTRLCLVSPQHFAKQMATQRKSNCWIQLSRNLIGLLHFPLATITELVNLNAAVWCFSYCSFYVELVKQPQPFERRTKEFLKDEEGWLWQSEDWSINKNFHSSACVEWSEWTLTSLTANLKLTSN